MSVFEPPEGAYSLNGQTLEKCDTRFPQFWEWINRNLTSGTILNLSDADYKKIFRDYGHCGGFVINTAKKSVRLPTLTSGTLWGTNNTNNIGKTLSAALPNIYGTFPGLEGSEGQEAKYKASFTGPFSIASANYGIKVDNENGTLDHVYRFDASKCSPIYGKSTTVQPPAIRVLWCIQVYHKRCVVSTFNKTDKFLEQQIQSLKNTIIEYGQQIQSLKNQMNKVKANSMRFLNYDDKVHHYFEQKQKNQFTATADGFFFFHIFTINGTVRFSIKGSSGYVGCLGRRCKST